jgi:hypothetical protein
MLQLWLGLTKIWNVYGLLLNNSELRLKNNLGFSALIFKNYVGKYCDNYALNTLHLESLPTGMLGNVDDCRSTSLRALLELSL